MDPNFYEETSEIKEKIDLKYAQSIWMGAAEAKIWALRLEFGPRGWDLSLEAGIWALRLGFGP